MNYLESSQKSTKNQAEISLLYGSSLRNEAQAKRHSNLESPCNSILRCKQCATGYFLLYCLMMISQIFMRLCLRFLSPETRFSEHFNRYVAVLMWWTPVNVLPIFPA